MAGLRGLNDPVQLWGQGAYNPESDYTNFKPITTQYGGNEALGRALNRATQETDRLAMAKQALADFDIEGAPQLEARFRNVGQRAATLGKTGSGMVTSELGTLQGDYERDRLLTQNQLIRDATEGTINDRYRALDALSRQDQIGYGRAQDVSSEQRGERGYRQGLGQEGLQNRIAQWQAQQGVRSNRLSEIMGLSGMGQQGNDLQSFYTQMADQYGQQAADAMLSVAQGFQGLGQSYGQRGQSRPSSPRGTMVNTSGGYFG